MKNKKKLSNRKSFSATPKVPGEWFYMCSKEITVEDIKKSLEEIEGIDLEIWKEMGVLEAELPSQEQKASSDKNEVTEEAEVVSLDFSLLELDLEDEYSNQFLSEHDVKTLFAVAFKPDTYECIKPVMVKVKELLGGFFCGDTEDFTPVI